MACSLVMLLFSGDFISPGTRLSELPMTAALLESLECPERLLREPFGAGDIAALCTEAACAAALSAAAEHAEPCLLVGNAAWGIVRATAALSGEALDLSLRALSYHARFSADWRGGNDKHWPCAHDCAATGHACRRLVAAHG